MTIYSKRTRALTSENVEQMRRATQDEMYRQILQVLQGTVDTFQEEKKKKK